MPSPYPAWGLVMLLCYLEKRENIPFSPGYAQQPWCGYLKLHCQHWQCNFKQGCPGQGRGLGFGWKAPSPPRARLPMSPPVSCLPLTHYALPSTLFWLSSPSWSACDRLRMPALPLGMWRKASTHPRAGPTPFRMAQMHFTAHVQRSKISTRYITLSAV